MRILALLALAPALIFSAETFTVTPVLVSAGAPLPPDLSFEAKPMGHEPGLQVSWLVKGEGIIGFKEGSMEIKTFTLTGAKGKPSGWKMESFPKASPDGIYGVFGLAAGAIPFEQASQVHLEGTVVMRVGDGTETVTVPDLALDAKAAVKAGAFSVKVASGGGMMGGGDGIGIAVTGPLDQIAAITVKAAGQTLKSDGYMGMNNARTWNFDKPAAGPLAVELKLWKGMKDVVVPFSYPAAPAKAGKDDKKKSSP